MLWDVNHVKAPPSQAEPPTPTRRERAQATRRRIIEAALDRFRGQGYAATTMETIAADAGVAVQTVYFTFHTKAELLFAALRVSGGERGDPEEPSERAWFGRVMAATSGARRLALIVELGNEIYRGVSPLMPAVRAGAAIQSVPSERQFTPFWQAKTAIQKPGNPAGCAAASPHPSRFARAAKAPFLITAGDACPT